MPAAPQAMIRAYRPPDFNSLYEIDQACYPPGIAYSRRTLKWFLAQPGAACLVGEIRGAMAGFILTEADGQSAHIITIDVLAEHRRSGLGTALLTEAEQHFKARGVCEVHLETAHDNAPAIAFWEKHGYRKRGVLPRYYLERMDAYWMMKAL